MIQAHGATVATKLDDLLPSHQQILAQVMHKVLDYAKHSLEKEKRLKTLDGSGDDGAYLEAIENAEPIYTFLLDGVRGSGKTTLALSICRFLDCFAHQQLGRDPTNAMARPPQWRKKGGVNLAPANAVDGEEDGYQRAKPLDTGYYGHRASVHCLPLLRPDDMDTEESIMEAVFAKMLEELRQASEAARKQGNDKRRAKAQELRNELLREVAKGWYFSQRLGVEALMNDSLSFEEYIERRGNEASRSHDRVRLWRKYVVKYLDFCQAQMLGIFVDDTDIARHLSQDLLHSIRMFFSHERIFSVVAGNLHATRQKLLADQMSQIAGAYGTLRSKESYTARFWREFERDNLEEYLAKVFPRQHRHFIKLQDADLKQLLHVGVSGNGPGGDRMSFAEFCTYCMRANVKEMLQVAKATRPTAAYAGGQAATRGGPTGMSAQQTRACENYLGFWLLRNHYAETLTPRSARHINQFHHMMMSLNDGLPNAEEDHPLSKHRRIAVTLFTAPANYQVVQRLTDHDSSVVDWVNAQHISSNWRGGRWLKINELKLPQTSPSYHFVLYRLDLEFAKPEHAFQNANFPTSMLPQPAGRGVWTPEPWDAPQTRQKWAKQLFKPYDPNKPNGTQNAGLIGRNSPGMSWVRQELQGLARTFGNPTIPANCIYFKDLRALPDLTWRWDETDGDTRRRYGQFPVRNVDNTFRLQQDQPQNLYFRRIVLLYGSYPLMPPVPSDEFTRGTDPLIDQEFDSLQLGRRTPITDSKPATGNAKKKQSSAAWIEDGGHLLASLIRYASLGHPTSLLDLLPESHEQFDVQAMARRAVNMGLRSQNSADKSNGSNGPAAIPAARDGYRLAQDILRIAPRYTRILDDVRRAYSALRIMEQDANDYAYAFGRTPTGTTTTNTDSTGQDDGLDHSAPFQLGRNDRIRLIDVQKFRESLGLNGKINDAASTDDRYSALSPFDHAQEETKPSEGTRSQHHKPVRGVWENVVSVSNENGLAVTRVAILKGNDALGIAIKHGFLSGKASAGGPWHKVVEDGQETPEWKFTSDILDEIFSPPTQKRGSTGSQETSTSDPGETRDGSLRPALKRSLLDTRSPETGTTDADTREKRRVNVERFRVMRSKLLFLWGIGPCLTSLIHLEAMGRIYAGVERATDEHMGTTDGSGTLSSEYKNPDWQEARLKGFDESAAEALDILDKWHTTLATAEALVYLGAVALETNLTADFDDIGPGTGAKSSNDGGSRTDPQFRPMPDFSIHTLGLRLYDVDPSSQLKDGQGAFGGIARDVLMRLRIGQIYANDLTKKIKKHSATQKQKQNKNNQGQQQNTQNKPRAGRGNSEKSKSQTQKKSQAQKKDTGSGSSS